jgi:hypothetical protein
MALGLVFLSAVLVSTIRPPSIQKAPRFLRRNFSTCPTVPAREALDLTEVSSVKIIAARGENDPDDGRARANYRGERARYDRTSGSTFLSNASLRLVSQDFHPLRC